MRLGQDHEVVVRAGWLIAMVMKSIAASGNYLSHDFIPNPLIPRAFPIGIFVPCVLVTTGARISVSGPSTPYALHRNHGFVLLSIEQLDTFEDYTQRGDSFQNTKLFTRHVGPNTVKALKDGYLVYIEDRCKMCRKKLKEEDDIFLHGELGYNGRECRSGEKVLNFERYLMVKDPYPYISLAAQDRTEVCSSVVARITYRT
ncbi:hypothetical protein HAX54_043937 [Datura stramonium]|uniref:Uncharacterized protein n=1 Tax=Datura stramonium TaxID=4076 RepID=A0ABS8W6A6_DATST|nr:hypothetical protein [Datura stramonium]